MSLKIGSRLRTPTSTTEVIVVRAGTAPCDLLCAGGIMTSEVVTVDDRTGSATAVQLGKRYTDDESGVEVLCTKPGAGPLVVGGRELVAKSAAALPASD